MPSATPVVLVVRVPDTRKQLGPMSVDLFKVMAGKSVTELLAPFTVEGPIDAQTPEDQGRSVDYLLSIPPQKGLTIPVTPFGALGIAHAGDGALSITYPHALRSMVEPLLERSDIRTSPPQDMQDATHGSLRQFFVATRPGLSFSLAVTGIGEIGIARPSPPTE